jgi:hypothetical protein
VVVGVPVGSVGSVGVGEAELGVGEAELGVGEGEFRLGEGFTLAEALAEGVRVLFFGGFAVASSDAAGETSVLGSSESAGPGTTGWLCPDWLPLESAGGSSLSRANATPRPPASTNRPRIANIRTRCAGGGLGRETGNDAGVATLR